MTTTASSDAREGRRDTKDVILTAAKECVLEQGYGNLSTRAITERAGVPLSQLHYHFGSKRGLVLALLEHENAQRLQRQARMYDAAEPLWKRWEQACDYLEDDLESGYVRVLQEMTAAGWSDDEVAAEVRAALQGWFDLLTSVFEEFATRGGELGPFSPDEAATLAADMFMGAETMILLGLGGEDAAPHRRALRRVGELIRSLER